MLSLLSFFGIPIDSAVLTFIIIVAILFIIWISLKLYEMRVKALRPPQHLCNYCGHMVSAVSDCHHAPVKEKFLHGICQECGKECRLVCARCKRPL